MGVGKRGVLFMGALAVCAAAPLSSCLDATEIVVVLTTDVPCNVVKGTNVYIHVGSPANIQDSPTTIMKASDCVPSDATASSTNYIGKAVVVPSSGFDSLVAISVALSDDLATESASCYPEPGAASCIYAHRQISFLPHTHVTLPIALSSACVGVHCVAPSTCGPDGKCTDGTVDPHDCGSSCSTGDDASAPDAITVDVPTSTNDGPILDSPADVPLDVSGCSGGTVSCNGSCVDIQTDNQNCGACGLDCTGGSCNGGTCTLSTSIVGSCLAVLAGTVYVATNAGVFTFASTGGSGSLYNNNNTDIVGAMASTTSDVAWIAGSSQNPPYIFDEATKMQKGIASYGKGVSLMALSSSAAAWFDEKTGAVYYLAGTSSTPLQYHSFTTTNPVPIAMGASYVYFSAPLLGAIFYSNGSTTKSVQVTSPGPIVVDDPNSTAPAVYDVENKTAVVKRDYQLANGKPFAASNTQITALAWDGQTLVANELTQISIAQGTSFVKLASATPAPKCIAVDSNAVYWLGASSGLFKHYKP